MCNVYDLAKFIDASDGKLQYNNENTRDGII